MIWWHWVIAGFVLVIAELAVPAFFLIWLGAAALITGALVWLIPAMTVAVQILLWATLSIAMVFAWMKYFRTPKSSSMAGQSSAIEGEVGLLVRDVAPFQTGQVRFQRPILGSDLWDCQSELALRAGSRVCVTAVEGRVLKVRAQ